MNTLVAVETLLLVGLVVVVAGLVRSHAETLRLLAESGHSSSSSQVDDQLPLPQDGPLGRNAPDISGVSVAGEPVAYTVRSASPSLLAFFSTGCSTCVRMMGELDNPSALYLRTQMRVLIVLKDPSHENVGRVADLLPAEYPHVFSDVAWTGYEVSGSPYFVLVDGPSQTVHSEGSTLAWDRVVSMVEDAVTASPVSGGGAKNGLEVVTRSSDGARPLVETTAERAKRAQDAMRAAGIGPGHPSLWPGGQPSDDEPPT